MQATTLLLALVCYLLCGCNTIDIPIASASVDSVVQPPPPPPTLEERMAAWMYNHTGIVEEPDGSNRGPLIDEWNRLAGVPLGSPWCGSAAGACLIANGHTPPASFAWSPSWTRGKPAQEPYLTGVSGTLFYPSLKRVGHVYLVVEDLGPSVRSWEGNTNDQGSRTGNRTAINIRPKRTAHKFTDYVQRND
jgi:hypothetical protein